MVDQGNNGDNHDLSVFLMFTGIVTFIEWNRVINVSIET